MIESAGFTLPNTGDCPCASATGAPVCADKFGGAAALHHDLSTLFPLLHAGDIHGLAFATNHRERVVRFDRFGLSCGRYRLVEHHLMLAGFHRLHLVAGAGVGRATAHQRQESREARTKEESGDAAMFCRHNWFVVRGRTGLLVRLGFEDWHYARGTALHYGVKPYRLLFLFFHSNGAFAGFGGAVECRVASALVTSVLEFGDFALAMAVSAQFGAAAAACVFAYDLGWLAMRVVDLLPICPLLRAKRR